MVGELALSSRYDATAVSEPEVRLSSSLFDAPRIRCELSAKEGGLAPALGFVNTVHPLHS